MNTEELLTAWLALDDLFDPAEEEALELALKDSDAESLFGTIFLLYLDGWSDDEYADKEGLFLETLELAAQRGVLTCLAEGDLSTLGRKVGDLVAAAGGRLEETFRAAQAKEIIRALVESREAEVDLRSQVLGHYLVLRAAESLAHEFSPEAELLESFTG